ncbi:global transcription factor group B1 [Arabidopsis thaliana]|uniref:Transcription elongation factor SPT6 homolog n=1 Tax=Arabidopsis thaliana TaxID=3702 RepID=SPT61_ARATH|nr:global transcription factor group B1 [Arabidopsis thaliana]NP_176723.3 global transcription factor group B1 [Arabidopsis thaliana]A8MS85.1 RecName: Full=Transcription elongation factor SPT6 homolog; Short=AtSPT6 [Arabidopsis thaliana]AEE34373.1 global transcription factor group B1 [Arabidopsis thaliana]ANM59396.1 global transcription factor group B1 [Arabidopsis thaliana]|eukprot:NP_001321759.1 global transcription factor group B1 [Arabidopsis thaliana]
MARNAISDDEEDHELEDDDGEPVHGDPAEHDENDDEEDDDDVGNEYENDGFIVNDEDEEEEEEEDEERKDSDEERQKKKKKRKKKDEGLDEDDYLLLQDNNVKFKKRQYKRLKKAQREQGNGQGESSDDEFDSRGGTRRSAEDKIKDRLFDDVDVDDPPDDVGDEEDLVVEEDVVGSEDEMADFIVDEDDEHGPPKRGNSKKKKYRQGSDITAMRDANEIFGDVDELLTIRKKGLASNQRMERRLEDEFEPTVLSEKYMTGNDDEIRQLDIPERMQISEESTGSPPVDEISIEEESNWIYAQLASQLRESDGTFDGRGFSVNKDDIAKFLELHHVQKLEIPFIAMYRKEQCRSLLDTGDFDGANQGKKPETKWHKVFWMIHDLDKKWLLLRKRKMALHGYYTKRYEEESRRVYDETRLNLNQYLFESVIKSLKVAETEREVDDVDSKFNLHFPPGEIGVDEGQYKRPKRKSQYSICSKAGLWEVANKFGYSAEQLGLALSLEKLVDELEDAKETPEEMAKNFVCAMFENSLAVLKGARHMAAVEISCEPSVKKYVRGIYMENAVVSTSPTADGNTVIDSFHQFSGIKWLREKPLSKFEGAQWLLIQKGEEEKLLQVTFKLPENYMNRLISDCNEHYLSVGVSKYAQLWNEQRKLILEDALHAFLLPSMEKEARSLLTSRAKSRLLSEYGQALWNKVSAGPYQKKEMDINLDEEAAPRVMACCWGPGKPPNTFVMLDSSGEVLDVLYAGSLTSRSQNVNDQQRKKSDQDRVLKFMMDHQPHVVALGAVNLSCTRLKDDIYEVIFQMVEEKPRDVGHGMDDLSIVYVDESLPRLYENSRISGEQLPQQSGNVRRAVALGRYLQNPLAMVATLCGPGREILSWKLHPLENFLQLDEKYGMVEQVMVDITNQVGIDINLAASHDWFFSPLQFISGLGPRKAASLQRSLVRAGSIFVRKDLIMHGLGKKVFVNAAGFLRIRRSGLAASSSQFIDLLDDTRIHPESYSLAQELAKDIYDEDVRGDSNDDEDAIEMAIEHVRDRPASLRKVVLDEYLASKKRENKKETYSNIIRELSCGFQDWRIPFKEPSPDEEFYMISGETEDTIAEGRIVQASVRRLQNGRAICVLDSGLTGMLMKEDFSDDGRDIVDLADQLKEGDILTCKIKSIQKQRYQVFLICKESEMRNNRHQHNQNVDAYYHEDRNSLQLVKEKARKEKELVRKHFKSRMIVHPRFQNITADQATEYLSDKDFGESIVRPSSRGLNFLTLTLKIYDGVYAHKEIAEGGKENKDITSLQCIGKTLTIGEDTFEDLDEVMDRYVDPLVSHLKTMLNYRKFRKGTKSEVDDLLRIEKGENPSRIVYCFGISHEHPGTFILSYIRSTNPHHEYIGLYPKGFKFRKRMFEDIDRLVAYFQRHIDDPLQESAPSIRSIAAKVPMRSPADHGSSGGSGWGSSQSEGGWKGNSDRSGSGRGGEYRNGGGRDGHPSGAPRPYGGRGRGRGRGRRDDMNSDRQDGNGDWGNNDTGTADGGWGNSGGGGWGSESAGKKTGGGSTGGWGSESGGNKSDGAGSWGSGSGGGGSGGWGNDSGGKKSSEDGGFGSGSGGGGSDWGNESGGKKSSADGGWGSESGGKKSDGEGGWGNEPSSRKSDGGGGGW